MGWMQIGSTTPSESHAGPSAYVGGLPGPSSVVTPGSYCQAALVRLICRGLLAAHTHEPGPHRRTGVGFDLMGIAAAGRATPAPRSGFVHGGVQVASGPQGLCAQVYVDKCIIVVHSPTLEECQGAPARRRGGAHGLPPPAAPPQELKTRVWAQQRRFLSHRLAAEGACLDLRRCSPSSSGRHRRSRYRHPSR